MNGIARFIGRTALTARDRVRLATHRRPRTP